MPEVKKQRGPASGKIDNTNTVGFEKVMPPVPGRKINVPTTISRAVADGWFKARLVTSGRMQGHGTDCATVAAKDKFAPRPKFKINPTLRQAVE